MLGNLERQRILPRQVPVIFNARAVYAEKILRMDPLAYWPLNETSGTTAYDASGNGYHGTYTGPALANAAAPGGGLAPYFDGSNDRADMQPAALLAALDHAEFTMMAWAKVLNAAVWTEVTYREVFHIRVNNNNRAYMIKPTTTNKLQFIFNGNSAMTKVHEWTVSSTAWMHMVLTVSVSGNILHSYINNVDFAPPSGGITAWAGTPIVGVGCDGSSSWWKGWLAHVAIWNRALSAGEVAALYAGGG